MLVSKNAKICEPPTSSRWVRQSWVCVGHVDFMLFVLFLVALGTQRKRNIQWNTGLKICKNHPKCSPHINAIDFLYWVQ